MVLPTLIREIEKRGRAQGLSISQIAATLGVDRTRFVHIRNGTGRLSLDSVHEVAARYLTDPEMSRLLLGYLAFDIPNRGHSVPKATLDDADRNMVSALVQRLPTLLVSGGGFLLQDGDAARLARVAAAIEDAVRSHGVGVLRERASAGLSLDRRHALLAAPLLIVDLSSPLREPVRDVLTRRAETARFTIAIWRPQGSDPPSPPLDRFRPLLLNSTTLANH